MDFNEFEILVFYFAEILKSLNEINDKLDLLLDIKK